MISSQSNYLVSNRNSCLSKKTRILLFLFTIWAAVDSRVFAMTEHDNHISPSTGMIFVKINGGCFRMGSTLKKSFEQPIHKVCVKDFSLGKYEVTQKQWVSMQMENRSKFPGQNRPVDMVSWNDAHSFIQKLNATEKTDRYRLPTEAEWEYAARGGTTTEYFWGDTMDDSYVWYYATAKFQTHPVGQTPQNPFGLHDMLGNVWEWTLDWFAKDYYGKSPQDNPKGPPKGIFKVRRGGSWANFRPYVRCATRYRGKLDHRHHTLGFRVVYKLK